MMHHPDKNNNNKEGIALFNEIKEAYEVLTNPTRKEAYLQERWLKKASGQFKTDEIITPPNILRKALEINKSVFQMDVHRMNYSGVASKICRFLSKEMIEQLNGFGDTEINRLIVKYLTDATSPFPLADTILVAERLHLLAGNDAVSRAYINRQLELKKQQLLYRKWKYVALLAVTIFICLLIYWSGQ